MEEEIKTLTLKSLEKQVNEKLAKLEREISIIKKSLHK